MQYIHICNIHSYQFSLCLCAKKLTIAPLFHWYHQNTNKKNVELKPWLYLQPVRWLRGRQTIEQGR